MTNNSEHKYIYLDGTNQEADWPKVNYDLVGVTTLKDLAARLRMDPKSYDFRLWLAQANYFPWVDNAPTEIRVAIRAHANFLDE